MSALLPIVAIVILIWFLMVRPQMRRSREARELQAALSVGDHVMLTSGIYAEVAGIGPDYVLVQLAEDVVVRMARGAILRVLTREELVKAGLEDPLDSDENAVSAATQPPAIEGTVIAPPASSASNPLPDRTTDVVGVWTGGNKKNQSAEDLAADDEDETPDADGATDEPGEVAAAEETN